MHSKFCSILNWSCQQLHITQLSRNHNTWTRTYGPIWAHTNPKEPVCPNGRLLVWAHRSGSMHFVACSCLRPHGKKMFKKYRCKNTCATMCDLHVAFSYSLNSGAQAVIQPQIESFPGPGPDSRTRTQIEPKMGPDFFGFSLFYQIW